MKIRDKFLNLWEKYFGQAELPICFYYASETKDTPIVQPPSGHRCVICDLAKVRNGESVCFGPDSPGCGGGKRYFGFSQEIAPDFEYFLSCGIPGKLEGERYKKSPELVREVLKNSPQFKAPAKLIVFKRWDKLEESDRPEVVIFFAPPDVLSGLFTLANYDQAEPNGVFAPFGAGCASIVQYPFLERNSKLPRGVLGMFDVSARPCIPQEVLSFAIPIKKFIDMIDNMEESFLTTASWNKVSQRIKHSQDKRQL